LLALSAGRFAEAEKLVPEAFALGERAQRGAALPIYRLHRLALYDFRGSLREVEQEISDLVAEFPARPVLRCARTYLYARLGRTEDARRELDDLAAAGFAAVPFDQEWLFAMSFLAEASAIVNDVESARVLYELLLPWAALNAFDVGEGIRGSVSRYLGLLAVTTERVGEAARYYDDALE